jgi:hypothetical protein
MAFDYRYPFAHLEKTAVPVYRCGYSEARKSTGGLGPVRYYDYNCPNPATWVYTDGEGHRRYRCNAAAHQITEPGWTKQRVGRKVA